MKSTRPISPGAALGFGHGEARKAELSGKALPGGEVDGLSALGQCTEAAGIPPVREE